MRPLGMVAKRFVNYTPLSKLWTCDWRLSYQAPARPQCCLHPTRPGLTFDHFDQHDQFTYDYYYIIIEYDL